MKKNQRLKIHYATCLGCGKRVQTKGKVIPEGWMFGRDGYACETCKKGRKW